jgi:hypothetical protein
MTTGKNIALIGFFLGTTLFVNAQSGTDWIVSKGVQRVANKKAFDEEKSKNPHIEAKTVAFPSIVVSKGVPVNKEVQAQGNIESKGYPTWTISEEIARKNQEMDRQNTETKYFQHKDISNEARPITKK